MERKDLLRLKGRVIDSDNNPVSNKIFVLNNRLAISDKDGQFEFPALYQGSYSLNTYKDEGYVYSPDLPLDIKLSADSLSFLNIKRYDSAQISGTLELFKPENNWFLKESPEFLPFQKLSGAKIILSSETKEYIAYSDINGLFSFDKLPAGKYKIVLDKDSMPYNFIPEWTEKEMSLEYGQKITVNNQLKEKLKKVKFKKIGE
jgi:hypothetical protein